MMEKEKDERIKELEKENVKLRDELNIAKLEKMKISREAAKISVAYCNQVIRTKALEAIIDHEIQKDNDDIRRCCCDKT